MIVVKVIAPASFASFCVSLEIPFVYSYGEYFITNTKNVENFKAYCIRKGISERDMSQMQFSTAEIDLDLDK